MELLEAFPVFHGRYSGLFHGAAAAGIRNGRALLYYCLFDDRVYHCEKADIRRPGVRMALPGLYHSDDQRCTVLLYGDPGTISGEDLYGGKEAAPVSDKGKTVNFNKILAANVLFTAGNI